MDMEPVEHPGMTCGASWTQRGTRCGAPAVFVDRWTRSDGKQGSRYYCREHARMSRHTVLSCVWPWCREPVVAILNDAPVCEDHAEVERARR